MQLHHKCLNILLASGIHDEEEVNEPPNTTATTCDELCDTETDVTNVETVNAPTSDKDGDNQRDCWVLELRQSHVCVCAVLTRQEPVSYHINTLDWQL